MIWIRCLQMNLKIILKNLLLSYVCKLRTYIISASNFRWKSRFIHNSILEPQNSVKFRSRYIKISRMYIMFETRVNLGNGIIKNLSSILVDEQGVPLENIWGTIEEFGIRRDELKKLDPSYKELFEIYSAIRAYRVSVRYLKQLKTRFA